MCGDCFYNLVRPQNGMPTRFDYRRVHEILGREAREAQFELVACDACARQYLADHEHLRIYTDPDNLSAYFLNTELRSKPCAGCHRTDWDFNSAADVAPEWQELVRRAPDTPVA